MAAIDNNIHIGRVVLDDDQHLDSLQVNLPKQQIMYPVLSKMVISVI